MALVVGKEGDSPVEEQGVSFNGLDNKEIMKV